jgi:hypothetical protein
MKEYILILLLRNLVQVWLHKLISIEKTSAYFQVNAKNKLDKCWEKHSWNWSET